MTRLRWSSLALAVFLLPLPARAELDLRNVERHVLDNGLTVLLLEDRNFPVVSVQMLYKVGARNEVTGTTGIAHFLEHMAFRDTGEFPDTEVVSRIYAQGGEWHGYTWIDQTTYFATAPRENLDLLLRIEAERMANLVVAADDMEAERGAVLAELHMYENDPNTLLLDAIMFTAFLAHPYRNNTIGFESDLEALTHADVRRFYDAHYHPANGVLAVVGDLDPGETLARVRQLFGGMERRPATPLPHTEEAPQRGERRIAVTGTAPDTLFQVGYRAPSANHADFAAFLVVQELLGGGSGVSFLQNDWGTPVREGRLLDGAAADLATWFPPSAQDFLFVIGGSPLASQTQVETEQAVEVRIAKLRESLPPRADVDDAVAAIRDELVYDVATTEDAAHQLAFFEGLGALDVLLGLEARLAAVTPEDVRRVAQRWLRPTQRVLAWYAPSAAEDPAGTVEVAPASQPVAAAPRPVDRAPVGAPVLGQTESGLPVIVQPSDIASSVTLMVVYPGMDLQGPGLANAEPEFGFAAWQRLLRPSQLPAALAAARRDMDGLAPGKGVFAATSTDPEARLGEELLLALQPSAGNGTAGAEPLLIVVVGAVDAQTALAQVGEAFADVRPGRALQVERASPRGSKAVSLGLPIAQAQLGYVVAAPAPGDADFLPWQMLTYILSHGYEGRFGKDVISRRGLAYYADAQYTSAGGPGWTSVTVGVDPGKVGALKNALLEHLAALETDPPTGEEVEEARNHMLGRALSAAQSNDELAKKLARHYLWFGDLPTVAGLRERLDAVGRDDVLRVVPGFIGGMAVTVVP